MATKKFENVISDNMDCEIRPGASSETMLVTTENYEDYEGMTRGNKNEAQSNEQSTNKIKTLEKDSKDNSCVSSIKIDFKSC